MLDLQSGKHYPYTKEGNVSLYVHKKSNHPPSILKNISHSINKQLSEISSDRECINKSDPTNDSNCNCRNSSMCLMDGKCNDQNLIYQAEVTTPTSRETYIGLCDTSFKLRYRNHVWSFKNERYKHATELIGA